MLTARHLSHVAAAIAAGSLVLAPVVQARAQTATATATAAATPTEPEQTVNPPTRVARLASISGTVSFHTAGEDHWDPATVNYPIATGGALWTEPGATASIEVSASRIDLASTTELDIDQLDPNVLVATQAQGETFLRLQDLVPGDSYTVRTPRGSVSMTTAGEYEIAAGDTQTPTTVTVIDGAAQVTGDNLAVSVQPGETATITGTGTDADPFRGTTGPAVRDAFLQTELSAATTTTAEATVTAHATATATASAQAAPPSVRRMPGARQLAEYGTWDDSPKYGRIWHPHVDRDWVPYRDGRWAYVAPWGWTWIDNEPWGYAPFHYGRWVDDDQGWAWAPTYYEPVVAAPVLVEPTYFEPVYAPALVSFFGFGAGFSIGVGVGFGFGFGHGFGFASVGWCPLGWGEPFRPWFGGGPRYFHEVNRTNVVNINNITYNNNSIHNTTINNFANAARGSTVVPTSAMVNSERIAGHQQPFSSQQFAQAHSINAMPSPTAHTAGVTPAVAQRLGLPDAAEARHASAPGPAVAQVDRHGAVPLRTPGGNTAAREPAGSREAALPRTAEPAAREPAANRPAETRTGLATPPAAREPNATTSPNRIQEAERGQTGLPALRAHGVSTHAGAGAPGPAITPRAQNASGPALGAREANPTANETRTMAGHSAPGPALTSREGAAAVGRSGLPPLRTPAETAAPRIGRTPSTAGNLTNRPEAQPNRGGATLANPEHNFANPQRGLETSRPTMPQARQLPETPRYQAPQQRYEQSQPRAQAPTPRYQAPQQRYEQSQPRAQAPTPRYQAPQQRYEQSQPRAQAPTPRYQAPQQRYEQSQPRAQAPTPRYQAPQQRFEQAQPQYQRPEPRYQMPQPHYAAPAPQPHYGAPRPAPAERAAPGGRRPWPP